MDLRPSLPLRSPLASLDSNHQHQGNQGDIGTLFSPGGRRTRRAASLKIRTQFEDDEESMDSSCENHSRTDNVEKKANVAHKPKAKAESKKCPPAKKRKKKPKRPIVIGRWETDERFQFLRGLRIHGRGNWKKIGESIPTRSTVQVKTHAQVMMRKIEQGIDIFQELDEYEKGLNKNSTVEEKKENEDSEANLRSSSSPLRGKIRTENKTANMRRPQEARASNRSRKQRALPLNRQHRHMLPRSNDRTFQSQSGAAPSRFQPVSTTTTVTTTTVDNHNHHHRFHHQGHPPYGVSPRNFNHRYLSYQYTPSFDEIARAASVATAASVAASILEHQHQIRTSRQVPLVANANQIYNRSRGFVSPSQVSGGRGTDRTEAEKEAVDALLNIRSRSESNKSTEDEEQIVHF